ncbi:MAG: (2Fe-2S)-binding protein [Proteobacteria bacterium]|nr:(2Fe-2S)-binding protein [Pseudomonadota bacterium]
MAKQNIELIVNGDRYEVAVEPNRMLVDVLREDLGLTGTKIGCAQGDCGACTVLMDGVSISSCLTLAVEAHQRDVTTIEGLATSPQDLHPIQAAFVQHGAVQCGYCTPGMVMSAKHLLNENPHPSEEEIRQGLSGNLCRCTGYNKIVEAIGAAADKMASSAKEG